MKNVMLDLETMGKGPNAAIVTIGGVFFDPMTGELGAEFDRTLCRGIAQPADHPHIGEPEQRRGDIRQHRRKCDAPDQSRRGLHGRVRSQDSPTASSQLPRLW